MKLTRELGNYLSLDASPVHVWEVYSGISCCRLQPTSSPPAFPFTTSGTGPPFSTLNSLVSATRVCSQGWALGITTRDRGHRFLRVIQLRKSGLCSFLPRAPTNLLSCIASPTFLVWDRMHGVVRLQNDALVLAIMNSTFHSQTSICRLTWCLCIRPCRSHR